MVPILAEVLKFVLDFRGEVRKEADYIAETIGSGIRQGFEDGFESVSGGFFKVMVASFTVVFGVLFLSYGAATFLEDYLDVPGMGFLAVGVAAFLLGLVVFLYSGKKQSK